MPHPLTRVLVADDHPVVRLGIRSLLPEDTFDIIGEASDGEETITHTLNLQPDILLLDIQMPHVSGLEALRRIFERTRHVKVILLTSVASTEQIVEALQLGARGIILKQSAAADLEQSIRAVLHGDYWIGGRRVENLIAALHELHHELAQQTAGRPQPRTFNLTPRELEVVGCITDGCSNKDIAYTFKISEETVKRHLSNIFDKTGVSTRLELALFAIAHKLNPAA
jgi:DNA-binding NarL/FixJ family response regulator